MARPRTVDREAILDAAEGVVAATGAPSLSFGTVAEKAGLSKATVQSAFGSRENLLEALISRWMSRENEKFRALAGDGRSERARVQTHVRITEQETDDVAKLVSTLLVSLAGSGKHSTSMHEWYRERLDNLEATTPEARDYRIAYLATEGAYLVRHLIGLEIPDAIWSDIFRDIVTLTERRSNAEAPG